MTLFSFTQRWGFFILFAILLYMARGIITPFVIAVVLAYIFDPLIDTMVQRTRVPRIAAVALFYVAVVAVLGFLIFFISGRLTGEIDQLRRQGPDIVASAVTQFTGGNDITMFGATLSPRQIAEGINNGLHDFLQTPSGALEIAKSVGESVLNTILMLLVLFYLLLDWNEIGTRLSRFIPPDRRERFSEVADNIHKVLGFYLRGQMLLIVLVSVVMYVILAFVFGLPYALPIAIASGFLEIIPLVGPALAAVIAAVVAVATPHLGVSGAIWVLLTYFIVRQIEDQVVMPLVVGRAVHLHPVITTFAVLAGGAIAGLLGTLLAIPAAAAINVIFNYCYPPICETDPPLHAQPLLGRTVNYVRGRNAGRNQRVAAIKGEGGER